ncbi:hypothetical protein GJ496_009326 [Pomphorhynchus laevis]|nr:hypothetical protein GJ496_009326 [Pomphorhynchus laevis]
MSPKKLEDNTVYRRRRRVREQGNILGDNNMTDDKVEKGKEVRRGKYRKNGNTVGNTVINDYQSEKGEIVRGNDQGSKASDNVKILSNTDMKNDPIRESNTHNCDSNIMAIRLQQLENIRHMRLEEDAPVDKDGCTLQVEEKNKVLNEKARRFEILVSLMLSSQTKDHITASSVRNLYRKGLLDPKSLSKCNTDEIAEIIKPVSFYRRKSEYLRDMAIFVHLNNDEIPNSIEGLCKIRGLGPKMAYLAMTCAWNNCVGIGVDTHVHRISNRLQWVKTKTAEHTRIQLEDWLPKEHWSTVNKLLVGFGQLICLPIGPKCNQCLNRNICPYFNTNLLAIKDAKGKKIRTKRKYSKS